MNKLFLYFCVLSNASLNGSKFLSSQAILNNAYKMEITTANIVNADTLAKSPKEGYHKQVILQQPHYNTKYKTIVPGITNVKIEDFLQEEHHVLGRMYKPNIDTHIEMVNFQEIAAHQDIMLRSYELTNSMIDKSLDLIKN